MPTEIKPITVAEYITYLGKEIAQYRANVIGEITEFQEARSGHIYISLKDKSGDFVLPCAIWRTRYQMMGVKLKLGDEIIVSGQPQIYAPRGSLSFIVNTFELAGEGALKKQYEALKKKLDQEGLFASARKRQLPDYVRKIGLITSAHGAAIHDFTNNLGKFGYKIQFIDSAVEGTVAVPDLIGAVRSFRNKDIQVLVIIRGGGSLESLMGFNNEALVREIASFPVPVLTGIGHDKDVTLSGLVADENVSVPEACAKTLNASWDRALSKVDQFQASIFSAFGDSLINAQNKVSNSFLSIEEKFRDIFERFHGIESAFREAIMKINTSIMLKKSRMAEAIRSVLLTFQEGLDGARESILEGGSQMRKFPVAIRAANVIIKNFEKMIYLNNPERTLRLGYSIARKEGKILRSTKDVNPTDHVELQLSDGRIDSVVNTVYKD